MHAACVTVALRMPRVRDAARCCVRKLVVAHTKSIVPGLGRGDGWCFEARNKKVYDFLLFLPCFWFSLAGVFLVRHKLILIRDLIEKKTADKIY